MPFNRVNNAKAMNLWLLVLSAYKPAKKEKRFAKSESPDDDEVTKPPACWCPGMMVVPLPQAGWFLGYWDMGYWAALFYVLGSIVYVVDSFYLWPYFYPASNDDPADPGVYWNTVASALFVINALLCFLDWYMQREQLSVMNMIVDESVTGGFQLQSVSTKITWYYFFNNFFFLGAAVVFLIQAMWMENYDWDIYHCSDGLCGAFWMNFWGNFLYVISSVFAFLEYWEDKKVREQQGLPPLTLLPYTWEGFDWFGWGDILYVTTSVLQTLQPFFMFSSRITEDFNDGFYLNANIFFLIDSLAYFIGYVIFLFDMRRALHSGQVPINQTGAIRDMIGDAMHLDTRASSERSISGGSLSDYPVFRRVEYGYVSIEEIREKLLAARDIRAHRASDPTGRVLPATNRITPIQATIAQRKSETSFSHYLNRPVSVDNLVKWGAKAKPVPIKEETEDETAMLLTESLLQSPDP